MLKPLDAATAALVSRFRRQRPLRGGSLIVTLFGDSIAPHGGAVTLGSLIALTQPFGLTERLVRTSVARLAQDDLLVARREGRLSEYQLSEHGRSSFADATRRIYGTTPANWNGAWTLVLLQPVKGGVRDGLRKQLEWLGFGQPAPGVFAHPARSASDAREQLAKLKGAATAIVLEARNDHPESDREFASAGWDLTELAARYRRLVGMFEPVSKALRGSQPEPVTAFVTRTLLIHEYRKIHLRDPLLPARLLPPDWIGTTAYELCRELYSGLFDAAEEHLSQTAVRLVGLLPAADAETFKRFGGLGEPRGSRAARRTA
ncbi:MAG TPA: phenylacetic acid degradation operon negative regulatory protein PaaX [Steroidobacteraceae bacterium]|jgi:phenylacetic acid degradation operon negative regulatory protein